MKSRVTASQLGGAMATGVSGAILNYLDVWMTHVNSLPGRAIDPRWLDGVPRLIGLVGLGVRFAIAFCAHGVDGKAIPGYV